MRKPVLFFLSFFLLFSVALHAAEPLRNLDSIYTCLDKAIENHGVYVARKEESIRLLRQQLKRSEEHTSELQSRQYLVCRLLLENKTMDMLGNFDQDLT